MTTDTPNARPIFPDPPQKGEPVTSDADLGEVARFLATRRSAGKMMLTEPGPDGETLEDILRVGLRVPDHRRVEPWRLIVVRGAARETLGDVIAKRFLELNPDCDEKAISEERARLVRAPVVVFAVSAPDATHKTPVWEQELSTGAMCHQLCLAAAAAGYGAAWLSEWICYDDTIAQALGLAPHERLAGQILIGTQTAPSPERPRPELAENITHWTGA